MKSLTLTINIKFDEPLKNVELDRARVMHNVSDALINQIQASERGLAPQDNTTASFSIESGGVEVEFNWTGLQISGKPL